jgi:hypothetical protein
VIGADEIVLLPSGEEEIGWIAQGINESMDLGAQSASRASDRLVFPFFWAPALC